MSQPSRPTPRANKILGQHFLKNAHVIQRICGDFQDQAEAIIEVGPGPGALTESLSKSKLPYYLVEKDGRFLSYLEQFVSKEQITHADALELSWSEFLKAKGLEGKRVWLVSNLPYNVGVPLFIGFIQCPSFQFLTLMFQKEVADKMLPLPAESHERDPKATNSKRREKNQGSNSLRTLAETYFQTHLLCKAPPHCFLPPPKVHSLVLSFQRRSNPTVPLHEFATFERFLRNLFQFRRKMISKGLRSLYSQEKIDKILQVCHISSLDRAESLGIPQIQQLYLEFSRNEHGQRDEDNC